MRRYSHSLFLHMGCGESPKQVSVTKAYNMYFRSHYTELLHQDRKVSRHVFVYYGYRFCLFLRFGIWIWNCSGGVVFCCCLFSIFLLLIWTSVIFTSCECHTLINKNIDIKLVDIFYVDRTSNQNIHCTKYLLFKSIYVDFRDKTLRLFQSRMCHLLAFAISGLMHYSHCKRKTLFNLSL